MIEPSQDDDLAERLLRIQRAAYRVEASLIRDDRIPGLHEKVEELCTAPLNWAGAFNGDHALVGAVAWTEDADSVDIDRLVVDPVVHRQGTGRTLVQAVLSQAAHRPTTVSTGRSNVPALTLYRGLGFQELHNTEVLPGLWVTHFEFMP